VVEKAAEKTQRIPPDDSSFRYGRGYAPRKQQAEFTSKQTLKADTTLEMAEKRGETASTRS